MTPTSEILVLLMKPTLLFLTGLALLRFSTQTTPAVRHLICLFTIGGSLAILATAFLPDSAIIIRIPATAELVPAGYAPPAGLSLTDWLLTLWACGCALVLLRLPIGSAILWRIRHRAVFFEAIPGPDARILPVFLADVNVPLLTGIFRPVILLPSDSVNWPQSRRNAAIRHELAHLERNDLRFNLARAVVCAVYWFHPLVWILGRRMSAEQESACDDRVLQSGFDRTDYADALVQTACCANRGFLPGCPMTNRSGVKARVLRVLSSTTGQTASTLWPIPSSLIAILVFAFITTGSLGAEHVYTVRAGMGSPSVLYQVHPRYTEAAKKIKLQGTVRVKLVVDANGIPRDLVVVKGVGSGLDENALQALKQWRFRPGTRNAEPVAVTARIDVNFRLR
jgi:TonB family protein